MKKYIFPIILLLHTAISFAQKNNEKDQISLQAFAHNSCECIDSINYYNKPKQQISADVNSCIKQYVSAYQLSRQLFGALNMDSLEANGSNKKIEIVLTEDEKSPTYQKYYFEMERYLRDSCKAMEEVMAANEVVNPQSVSENPEALDFYYKGVDAMQKEDLDNAIANFEKALLIDQYFAFAWDNLGLCYRKKEDYDGAIRAYQKSLAIDPKGVTPLQNIAIAYQFKKEYKKAIEAFKVLETIDKNDPEVYYGIGRTYALYMGELEKGLDYMCKAYNLYVEQKSPYRTDAEQVMSMIYAEMDKKGNADKFAKILKENNISISDE